MKLAVKSLISIVMAFACTLAHAQSTEYIEGLIWPEIDFKNVQFLPYGHLHKNKPRYGKYEWKVVETPHFQIYAYGVDERLTNLYVEDSEAIYREFSAKMNMNRFTEKIRVVIFNSARDFEEANIIWGLVPKGLGGQTEMIKWKRVVVAFRDSPEGFRRLLRHELVHRYQGEFLGLTLMNFMFRDVPLWFSEGSAEHYAHPWDSRGEHFMRDAYLKNYLAHPHQKYSWNSNGLVYKQGEYVLHFLAEEYKHRGEVIAYILRDSVEMKFEEAFKKNTGDTLEEFDKKLFRHIEKQYSSLRAKVDIADDAKSVGKGTLLAAKDQFFIIRKTVGGRETLYLNWTNGTATQSKKLVSGGYLKSVDMRGFEVELSPEFGFQEHGASFASSNTLVYSMDVGGHDEIVVQSFYLKGNKKKLKLGKKKKYQITGVRELQYPVILNEQEIAFVGRGNGAFAELYIANINSGSVRKLTDAQRTYRCLTYSQSENSLITSVENEITKSYDLARFDLKSGSFTYLTQTEENEFSAIASDDGNQILYTSDKGLVHNVHRYNFLTHQDEILTDAKRGIFRPQWFNNGLAFTTVSMGESTIQVAPFPQKTSSDYSVRTSSSPVIWDLPETQKLRKKIPNVELMTLFDVALSSDKHSAVFAENRKLSMEELSRKDPEIRFHYVNASSTASVSFIVSELKKLKHYGAMEILPGTNVLLQKKTVYREKVSELNDPQNRNLETEVTYKESFIYDWAKQEMHDVDTEISSEYDGTNRSMTQMSPDRRYLIWSDKEKNRITVYDIAAKKKEKIDHSFYEIQKVHFISDTKLMVLDKKWDLSLAMVDITSNTTKVWDAKITEKIEFRKSATWFPLKNGERNFIVVPVKDQGLSVYLFDTEKSTVNLIASEIPLIKHAETQKENLVLTVANEYGLNRKLIISSSGTVTATDEKFSQATVHSTKKIDLKQHVTPRPWNIQTSVPSRIRKISRIPKVMHAYGVGGVVFGSGGVGTFLSLQMLAFDEISDHALATDIYLQNTTQGIADIQYYDMDSGRSYLLDYWNFDGRRHKLDLGISQNIFLHEFVNWDVTLKQQKVYNPRDSGTAEWWRSNVGTTLSLDTTIWDCEANYWACHGPHSGAAIFTGAEANVDNKRGFQAIDLNLDARYHIPFTDRSGLAVRAIGGRSLGPNPNAFVWGGNGTMRGIPLFSEAGNAYAMQSTELRVPILNAAGAVLSGPVGEAFAPLTVYMDIRGGVYHDIGDMWYVKTPRFSGHQGMKIQQSAGYFVNVPTALGLTLRFNKGFYGRQDWNFWLGYNW